MSYADLVERQMNKNRQTVITLDANHSMEQAKREKGQDAKTLSSLNLLYGPPS